MLYLGEHALPAADADAAELAAEVALAALALLLLGAPAAVAVLGALVHELRNEKQMLDC